MVKIPRFVGVRMCEEKPKSRKEKEKRNEDELVFAAARQNVQSCIACRAQGVPYAL